MCQYHSYNIFFSFQTEGNGNCLYDAFFKQIGASGGVNQRCNVDHFRRQIVVKALGMLPELIEPTNSDPFLMNALAGDDISAEDYFDYQSRPRYEGDNLMIQIFAFVYGVSVDVVWWNTGTHNWSINHIPHHGQPDPDFVIVHIENHFLATKRSRPLEQRFPDAEIADSSALLNIPHSTREVYRDYNELYLHHERMAAMYQRAMTTLLQMPQSSAGLLYSSTGPARLPPSVRVVAGSRSRPAASAGSSSQTATDAESVPQASRSGRNVCRGKSKLLHFKHEKLKFLIIFFISHRNLTYYCYV